MKKNEEDDDDDPRPNGRKESGLDSTVYALCFG